MPQPSRHGRGSLWRAAHARTCRPPGERGKGGRGGGGGGGGAFSAQRKPEDASSCFDPMCLTAEAAALFNFDP